MSDVNTFACPRCGGAVELHGTADRTVRCPFCHSTVIVPEALRAPEAPQVVVVSADENAVTLSPEQGRRVGRLVLVIVLVVVGFICIGSLVSIVLGIGLPMGAFAVSTGLSTQMAEGQPDLPLSALETASPSGPGFASQVLRFGGEGIGPGLFEDARHVAVDAQGHIFVADYLGGRVQVFDDQGTFVTQWTVDSEMPLRGMAASRDGQVYIVQSGTITRRDGLTGEILAQIAYPDGDGFDAVAVAADRGLVAAWYLNRDDIVRFDPSGNVLLTIPAAVSAAGGDSELDTRVAIDGLGNIYALGQFNEAVFVFAPDGHFVTRFGGSGDEPGQFRAPDAVAVDGQGRVYVSDFKGVQVFDSDGRYLGVIDVDGAASGLAVDDQGRLVVAVRTFVVVFSINP